MAVNQQRISFTTFQAMAAHLDRWADTALVDADGWNEVLIDTRSWLDYSARNQALLASYGADGAVAGQETWRLVPSTSPERGCGVRAGEHGYPVRVPVTTGGTEPDPYLGGHRPTTASVERWEWRPVFSIAQLARRPAPDTLIPTELPAALTGPDADAEFLAAVRKVATATVRGRLPRSSDPHAVLADAAGRVGRSGKRPELGPVLREQVAWLVADRVGLAPTHRPPRFDPSDLPARERWERLLDVLEPSRKLTAALGVATGVDLIASPLPRMEIVDDRVVPAGRRHRLPPASLEQLPIGQWVTVGPYTAVEWAARGEGGTGRGAYLLLNKTAYLAAVETGDTASWRLEDVAERTGHGQLATGTAPTLDHARNDAIAAMRDRYPALTTTPEDPMPVVRPVGPAGTADGWEQMPGAGRTPAELRHLDDQITLYAMPGPGGRWQPAIHTTTSGVLERLPLQATLDEARDAAEIAGRNARRAAAIADPVRADAALAAYADGPGYDRRELEGLIGHRLDAADRQRIRDAEPAELVELLGSAGFTPAATVAVLAAESLDPQTVAGLLPTVGVPMTDAIRVLRERWDMPAVDAAEALGATGAEMRIAGCSPVEIMAARPRDVLRTLPTEPGVWELAAGTMAVAGHTPNIVARHLAAHAPTPDAFAAGLTAIADAAEGLAIAARAHAHPDQLAAASEAYGLSPTDTATALADLVDADVVLSTLKARCGDDVGAAASIAADAGIAQSDVDEWMTPLAVAPVISLRPDLDTDTADLLAALPPPGPASDIDPIDLLDTLSPPIEPTTLEPTP